MPSLRRLDQAADPDRLDPDKKRAGGILGPQDDIREDGFEVSNRVTHSLARQAGR